MQRTQLPRLYRLMELSILEDQEVVLVSNNCSSHPDFGLLNQDIATLLLAYTHAEYPIHMGKC